MNKLLLTFIIFFININLVYSHDCFLHDFDDDPYINLTYVQATDIVEEMGDAGVQGSFTVTKDIYNDNKYRIIFY